MKAKQHYRVVRSLKNCDRESPLSALNCAPWSTMDSAADIDRRWESLFEQVVDSHIPMKRARVRAKTLPWITEKVRKACSVIQLSSCNAFLPKMLGVQILFLYLDFVGELVENSGYVSVQVLHCIRVCFCLSSYDNLFQASVLKIARKSPFVVAGCHFLLKRVQMAGNRFDARLY